MPRLIPIWFALALATGCSESKGPTDPVDETTPPGVASVSVSNPGEPLSVGETVQLTAVVRDTDGEVMEGAAVEWSTTAPGVATVTSSGLATAVAPGHATIRATAAGRTGSALLEVESPPILPAERGSIAYVKEDELRLIEPDGTGDRLVWKLPDPLNRITGVSWRPDGGEIAFSSDHELAVSFYERDIYAIRPDGTALRKLTNGPTHEQLQGRPKGTVTVTVQNLTFDAGPYFVYLEGAPEPKSVTLPAAGSAKVTFIDVADLGEDVHQPAVVINGIHRWWDAAAGADVRPGTTVDAGTVSVTANPLEHFGADAPFWRGDGSSIGFIGTPTCLLQRVPAEPPPGASYTPLVDPAVWQSVCAVDWAPSRELADQLLLADMSGYVDNGETRIYRVPEGSGTVPEPVIVFDDYVRVFDLRWMPDGSGLVVARQDGLLDQDVNLYRYDFATQNLQKLTDFTGEFVRSFSIAPDGKSIAFERITGGDFYDLVNLPSDLWLMGSDGSTLRLLVAGGRLPAW